MKRAVNTVTVSHLTNIHVDLNRGRSRYKGRNFYENNRITCQPESGCRHSKTLLSHTTRRDTPVFERVEITNFFEIKAIKNANVVFRFTNDKGLHKFDYEERLFSFD